jgi:hypothetical protein
MEILVRIISSNYITFRTPTILMRKLGVKVQPVVDRLYHNRSKVDTHIDGYVTM